MDATLAALEWPKVLQLVAAFCKTGAGRELLLATVPDFARQPLAYELAQDMASFLEAAGTLPIADLEALRLLEGSSATLGPPELLQLVRLVRTVEEVRQALAQAPLGPALSPLAAALPNLGGFLAWCEQRLAPDGQIPDTASPALAQARKARERLRAALTRELEQLARQFPFASGPYTLRRDRYCLPIPAGERGKVPGLVLDASGSGATLFVEPFSLVELNNALSQAQAQIREEEERILAELAAAFRLRRDALADACRLLATLDAFQARVLFGKAAGGVLLRPGSGARLEIRGARHPLLDPRLAPLREQVLGEAGNREQVVPTELAFPPGVRVLLISGPNAGGKTVALKTVGLLVLQTFAGIPALAEEGTVLPQLSGVFCHIGDEQNVLAERSTFQAAMAATARLLAREEAELLVLYDELGSGTDPEEGQALAAALLEELAERGWWTLATSHLAGLAAHVESIPTAANAAMGYDEVTGRPTYRLRLGAPGRSRGLALARSCGVPARVLARAEALVSQELVRLDRTLARLEAETAKLEQARRQLALREEELRQAIQRAEEQAQAYARSQQEMQRLLRQEVAKLRQLAQERWAKVEAELAELKKQAAPVGRRKLAQLRSLALSLPTGQPSAPAEATPLSVGDTVEVAGFPGSGQVLATREGRVEVAIGGKKLWVEREACRRAAPQARETKLDVEAQAIPRELVLLGLDREEARERLEKFLDGALASGVRQLRIVHGHGTGTLRRVVWEVLASFPGVASYRHPPQYRGGTGVTEVELEG
jgi:DNA mismatch repair protein MutS2